MYNVLKWLLLFCRILCNLESSQEHCSSDKENLLLVSNVYNKYVIHCKENRIEKPLDNKSFGRLIIHLLGASRKTTKLKDRTSIGVYHGIQERRGNNHVYQSVLSLSATIDRLKSHSFQPIHMGEGKTELVLPTKYTVNGQLLYVNVRLTLQSEQHNIQISIGGKDIDLALYGFPGNFKWEFQQQVILPPLHFPWDSHSQYLEPKICYLDMIEFHQSWQQFLTKFLKAIL